MLAQLAAERRPTARGPKILHVSEEIKDVPLLQSSSAASTIESPSKKNTLVLPQFSPLFLNEAVEFVEQLPVVFANCVHDAGKHRFRTGSAAAE